MRRRTSGASAASLVRTVGDLGAESYMFRLSPSRVFRAYVALASVPEDLLGE